MRAILLTLLLFLITSSMVAAQSSSDNIQFYGDFKLVHIGFDTDASGLGGNDINGIRFRPGLRITFNDNHSFSGRMVLLKTIEKEDFEFTIAPNAPNGGVGLAFGSLSFDEFYYQYKDEKQTFRIGRFQESFKVLSNAGRSIDRFQSNAVFVHWTDGISYNRVIGNQWTAQAVLEYQNRDHISYPYSGRLDFGDNEHNMNMYLGLNNRGRDQFNLIQRDIGVFVAPNGYFGPDGYETYASISSRAVMDLPEKDLLRGGSFRIAGELGQVVTTDFQDGTIAVISAGINNFADRHEFMVEFTTGDRDWLHASNYAPATDEMEIRYRIFLTGNFQMDTRYRVRVPHNENLPYQYSTFIRATYTF
ncbi:hypothetical protein AB2B38_011900 [Balneola sp. MJW-20]|uniref:hypothetical protein n=1 Tax=Gracilimonas aurantiaca TaxID=3234185 RepID=UPI003467D036